MADLRTIGGKKVSAHQPADVSRARRRKAGPAQPTVSSRADDASDVLRKPSVVRFASRHPDIGRAVTMLAARGDLAGVRSEKISVRVDPRVFAAASRLGLPPAEASEVVNAALAIAAADQPGRAPGDASEEVNAAPATTAAADRFKEWWRNPGDPLPDDFELAI